MGEEFRDRRVILVLVGGLLLVGGVAVGFFGPLEMYCFTLFSEGGRFHYEGFVLIDVSIFCLAGLTWGLLKRRPRAWWGSLVFLSSLTVSVIVTFPQYGLLGILARLRFPPTEVEILDGLPFHGVHLALALGVPLLVTLGLLVYSKRYFSRSPASTSGEVRRR